MVVMIIVATLPLFMILPINGLVEQLYYNTWFIAVMFFVTGALEDADFTHGDGEWHDLVSLAGSGSHVVGLITLSTDIFKTAQCFRTLCRLLLQKPPRNAIFINNDSLQHRGDDPCPPPLSSSGSDTHI